MALPPHRFLNWVYYMCVRNMSKEQRTDFDHELAVPISPEKRSQFEAEEEAVAFDALYAQVNGVAR